MFDNLALLFAMGVSIGMAKKEKEVAALPVQAPGHEHCHQCADLAKGGVETMAANSTTSVLGITTLQMGVFGGILVGLGVAALHNRFYKMNCPGAVFFGGTRFVPIISTVVYLIVGVVMFYLWPIVQPASRIWGHWFFTPVTPVHGSMVFWNVR
ncbi:MAG: PTS transporter subunit EIIC [Ruminococcus sp.]